jgi:succinoglycan biosynthesis transport protein ExoP
VQILQSRDIARQVIRELKLGDRPDFDPMLSGVSSFGAFLSAIGLGRDRLKMSPEERVMEAYFDRLTVTALERSRVITIEFQSGDPELSANVVNAIVDAYLKLQLVSKQEQTRSASGYLASEIQKLRKSSQDADSKVEEFRAKANLFLGASGSSLSNQQLGELTTQLAAARAQKADLESRSRIIRSMLKSGKSVETNDVVNSDLLKRLVEQRVLLRSQLAEQSSTLLGRHPRIQELSAQINALDEQMRGELVRVVNSLENDARIAEARVEATNDSLDRLKKQIGGASSQDVHMRALEREAKAQRDLLESYLARYREAAARENIDSSLAEARVISRATVSNVPAFPKKIPILLIAMLATAFLMAAYVLSSEILRQGGPRVASPALAPFEEELAPQSDPVSRPVRRTIFSVLKRSPKAAPAHASEPQLNEQPLDEAELPTEAAGVSKLAPQPAPIADIAKALQHLGEAGRKITVVGAARNVGTTHTALTLARALASEGGRVVLCDLALNAPNLSVLSTDPQAPGFADLVRGTASFGDIVTRDKFSRVQLIATGRVAGDAQAILSSPRLIITLEALARTYDQIVIDAGALGETTLDPLARMAPRALLVATDLADPATQSARRQLMTAGFADVMLVHGTPVNTAAQPAAA